MRYYFKVNKYKEIYRQFYEALIYRAVTVYFLISIYIRIDASVGALMNRALSFNEINKYKF